MKTLGIMRNRIGTDGEGITDLVALAGCPLSCRYCLNKNALAKISVSETDETTLLADVMQEYCYFVATGGGVTFGGGEPLMQVDEIVKFAAIKPKDVKINIETSLYGEENEVKKLLPVINRWIIDIKSLDKNIYENYTNGNFDRMFSNLMLLAATVPERCVVRVPVIEGYKTENKAKEEAEALKKMGFQNIDIFKYTIRKEK